MQLNGKKILITGATGFIGANLVRYLIKNYDCQIYIFIRETSNLWRINDIINFEKIKIYYCDIRNKEEVYFIFREIKPDIVYHLATYGMFLNREKDKESIITTNINALFYLIEASKEVGVKRFINTGTTSEYGIKNKPMREDMKLDPVNTYGATKASGTILATQLAQEYNFNLITLRLFSPYGYYEDKDRLFPYLILKFLNNEPIKLSNKNSVRDFTFIEDIINGYIQATLIDNIKNGEVINIGYGKQKRIIDIVQILEKIKGDSLDIEWGKIPPKQEEPVKWEANNKKARKILKWKPYFTLEKGIKKLIDWFKENKRLYY